MIRESGSGGSGAECNKPARNSDAVWVIGRLRWGIGVTHSFSIKIDTPYFYSATHFSSVTLSPHTKLANRGTTPAVRPPLLPVHSLPLLSQSLNFFWYSFTQPVSISVTISHTPLMNIPSISRPVSNPGCVLTCGSKQAGAHTLLLYIDTYIPNSVTSG